MPTVPIKQKSPKKVTGKSSGIRNSTNLKRISAAQQPPSQKQITNFFRSTKINPPTDGYFDTHRQSIISKTDNTQSVVKQKIKTSGKVGDRTKKPHQNDDLFCEIQNHIIPEAIINDDSGMVDSESSTDNSISVASQRGTCPRYKVVEGTSFAVDAFRYGDIEGVTKYFLTHYHADHFMGLKKSFNKPLFASTITGNDGLNLLLIVLAVWFLTFFQPS